MPGFRALCLTFLLLFCTGAAIAREAITDYQSEISVLPSGVLDVRETITVRAEGNAIRHGIYRDFQTVYRDGRSTSRVGFRVLEVRLDGAPVPYRLLNAGLGKRLLIGDPDRFVSAGRHRYEIHFTSDRQIKFFAERDELLYQPIAYGWGFPIERARVSLMLPGGVQAQGIKVSAGARGAGEGGANVSQPSPGVVLFTRDTPLAPGEGMTIAVTWPRGAVVRPTWLDELRYFLADNKSLVIAIVGFLLVLGYYLWAWWRVGRDPAKGTIIAQYDPPDGFSPAAVRYVLREGWDDTAFAATIVSLAVKRALEIIEDEEDVFRLRRRKGPMKDRLSRAEQVVMDWLFDTDADEITIDKENAKILANARIAHRKALAREHLGVHFRRNRGHFIAGLVLSVLVVLVSIYDFRGPVAATAALLGLMMLLNPLFAWLLKAPTMKGRRIMDHLEGFKLYLSVAEKDRLNFHNPPERTPELFERYLPYAIALGVEQEWGEQFDDVLKAARDPETGVAWQPGWYHGPRWYGAGVFHGGRFAGGLAGAMATSFAAAAVPPSSTSSSGFSGGFSGGVGGGGG
ncbi:MAG: DUF2207 domain-containing protein, partial [Alphaproteobacteria bacterium]